jgi:hypothetical protein
MQNKKVVPFFLIILFVASLITVLITHNKSDDIPDKTRILYSIPLATLLLSLSLFFGLYPKQIDKLVDKLNLLNLQKIPKNKEKRIKFYKFFGYGLAIFSLIFIIGSIIMHFLY